MTSQPTQSRTAGRNTCTSDWSPGAIAQAAINVHLAQQNPRELALLLAYLAAETRPRTVVELGLGDGGLAWALLQLPSKPRVLSVSLPRADEPPRPLHQGTRHHLITGDTQAPATAAAVERWLGATPADVLVIDADHRYEQARHDWTTYAPMVSDGGLVVLHDIAKAVDFPDVQVHKLWAELSTVHTTTEIVNDPSGLAGTGLIWL